MEATLNVDMELDAGSDSTDRYYKLLGCVLQQALLDFWNGGQKKWNPSTKKVYINYIDYHDAKEFLFTDRLERWLERWTIDDKINPEYIRKVARKEIKEIYYYICNGRREELASKRRKININKVLVNR